MNDGGDNTILGILGFGLLAYLLLGGPLFGRVSRAPTRSYQRRMPRTKPRARGSLSGVRADVASALKNQGFSPAAARRAATAAAGSSFDEIFRSAVRRGKA